MNKICPPRLDQYEEHGLGRHVIVLKSEYEHTPEPFLKNYLDKQWKVHYMTLNLNEDGDILSRKLSDTLNYYHYIKNFILDFTSFLFLLKNMERVHSLYTWLENILVLDPINLENYEKRKRLLKNEKLQKVHKGFLGENVELPDFLSDELIGKVIYLNSDKAKIISITDPRYALKLSSYIKNSIFEPCKTINKTYELISSHFNE